MSRLVDFIWYDISVTPERGGGIDKYLALTPEKATYQELWKPFFGEFCRYLPIVMEFLRFNP